ncbi:hypothetical protein [uncultured Roseobacter sp.]|nr:hypothetical protein [uncultured Roseobacter sp.]
MAKAFQSNPQDERHAAPDVAPTEQGVTLHRETMEADTTVLAPLRLNC